MKYMLLIYTDEDSYAEGEREQCYVESTALTHDLKKRGKYLGASPLHSVATATSVRVRDGKRQITDGPFAETREQLGRCIDEVQKINNRDGHGSPPAYP